MATAADPGQGPIVFFDGVCRTCSKWVQLVLANDPKGRFRYASLQSPFARRTLEAHGLDPDALDTVVLVDQGRAYARSTAALRVLRSLAFPWSLAGALLWVPRVVRDAAYDVIARNRYRWFGKNDACFIPTAAERSRFLDDA
jgi:predicted DCC family thiol-disulfide oxidoreductase YuxK